MSFEFIPPFPTGRVGCCHSRPEPAAHVSHGCQTDQPVQPASPSGVTVLNFTARGAYGGATVQPASPSGVTVLKITARGAYGGATVQPDSIRSHSSAPAEALQAAPLLCSATLQVADQNYTARGASDGFYKFYTSPARGATAARLFNQILHK